VTAARTGDRVRLHYIGRLENGNLFAHTGASGPVDFEIGKGDFLQNFEDAIVGMTPGESKTIHLGAHEAFGKYELDLIRQVDRKKFGERSLSVGSRVHQKENTGKGH